MRGTVDMDKRSISHSSVALFIIGLIFLVSMLAWAEFGPDDLAYLNETYARLDGTNQPFTDDIMIIGNLTLDRRITFPTSIEIGNGALSTADLWAIAIGHNTIATGDFGIAIGHTAASDFDTGIAVGFLAHAGDEDGNIAIGDVAYADEGFTIAIGSGAAANRRGGVSIGENSVVDGIYGISIGASSVSNNESSISIGDNYAGGNHSISIGHKVNTTADDSFIIGVDCENAQENSFMSCYDDNIMISMSISDDLSIDGGMKSEDGNVTIRPSNNLTFMRNAASSQSNGYIVWEGSTALQNSYIYHPFGFALVIDSYQIYLKGQTLNLGYGTTNPINLNFDTTGSVDDALSFDGNIPMWYISHPLGFDSISNRVGLMYYNSDLFNTGNITWSVFDCIVGGDCKTEWNGLGNLDFKGFDSIRLNSGNLTPNSVELDNIPVWNRTGDSWYVCARDNGTMFLNDTGC